MQSSTSIVSIDFTESKPDGKPVKLMNFLHKNQINFQIIIIYAEVIGIVLEGSYSIFLFLTLCIHYGITGRFNHFVI